MTSKIPPGLSQIYWKSFELPRSAGSVIESLPEGEAWIGSWDGVGLYEGLNNKLPNHQETVVHLTTHRLIIINSQSSNPSLQTSLSFIRQTEFYNGFMRSSAKITLYLGRSSSTAPSSSTGPGNASSTVTNEQGSGTGWTCGVCGFVNPLSDFEINGHVKPGAKCSLCGVGYSLSRNSSSIPPSRTTTPAPSKAAAPTRIDTSLEGDTSRVTAPSDPGGSIACPACTFLNHRYLTACEICSTPLPITRPRNATLPPIPASNGVSNDDSAINASGGGGGPEEGRMDIVRLSFRKGGEKEAYKRLKNVLSDKAWERDGPSKRKTKTSSTGTSEEVDNTSTSRTGIGIDGILQSIDLDAKNQDDNMQDAFKDLEILMVRAGEMVRLAQSLNAKLTAQQASAGPNSPNISEQETTLIRTSLVQLGLAAPALTQDMMRDTREYHEGLARELGGLLTGRMMSKARGTEGLMVGKEGRGVIGLDEVWGLWMRARGVALLSPSTLVSIIPHLPQHTNPPIRQLSLASNLKVLHTPHYAPETILSRLLNLLSPPTSSDNQRQIDAGSEPSLSLVEIAAHEGLAIGLAKELVENVESVPRDPGLSGGWISGIVRDEQAGQEFGGVRWYRDLISVWDYDGSS